MSHFKNATVSAAIFLVLGLPVLGWAQVTPLPDLDDLSVVDRHPAGKRPSPTRPTPLPAAAPTQTLQMLPEQPVMQFAGSTPDSRQSSKGLFAAAFAPIAAQAVGQGLSHLLSKLVDTWFSPAKPVRRNGQAISSSASSNSDGDDLMIDPRPARDNNTLSKAAQDNRLFGVASEIAPGLAVRVLRLDDNDRPVAQVPAMGARFVTGESAIIELTANMPGILKVTNINPKGERKILKDGIYLTPGSTNVLPSPGEVFYFKSNTGTDQLELLFSPCKAASEGQRTELLVAESLAGTKDIAVRGNRLQAGLRNEDPSFERGLTRDVVFNKLQHCGGKDMDVRQSRSGLLNDGMAIFTDSKVIDLRGAGDNSGAEISGAIRATLEFHHIAK